MLESMMQTMSIRRPGCPQLLHFYESYGISLESLSNDQLFYTLLESYSKNLDNIRDNNVYIFYFEKIRPIFNVFQV